MDFPTEHPTGMCDNTDCKNNGEGDRPIYPVEMKAEFEGGTVFWCKPCCERDEDFIKGFLPYCLSMEEDDRMDLPTYIQDNASRIAVREKKDGKWGSYFLTELTAEQAIAHVVRFIKEGRIPTMIREEPDTADRMKRYAFVEVNMTVKQFIMLGNELVKFEGVNGFHGLGANKNENVENVMALLGIKREVS